MKNKLQGGLIDKLLKNIVKMWTVVNHFGLINYVWNAEVSKVHKNYIQVRVKLLQLILLK